MYCVHCGKSIPDNSGFCIFCGKPINDNSNTDGQGSSALTATYTKQPTSGANPIGRNEDMIQVFGYKVSWKILYRVLSVIVLCIFFLPTATLSCAYNGDPVQVSAAHASIGYKDEDGDTASGMHSELWLMLAVPIAIIYSTTEDAKRRKVRQDGVALIGGAVNFFGWLYYERKVVEFYYESPYAFEGYKILFWYYLVMIISVVISVCGVLELYLGRDGSFNADAARIKAAVNPEKIKRKTKRVIDAIRSDDDVREYEEPAERLYTCLSCRKIFAIKNNSRTKCPNCEGRIRRLDLTLGQWQAMTKEDKNVYIDRFIERQNLNDVTYID